MKLYRVLQALLVLVFGLVLCLRPSSIHALYDPLTKPNNMYGIHILFTHELEEASSLVNSSGGEWGYVTVPIQISDRDYDKWQEFMDKCRSLHLTPILRISTEPFYENTHVWRIPNDYDIVDLANFLNSLDWPVENRYVIVFNEMNRYDEWGGSAPDPAKYADVLEFTYDAFKKRNNDFFVIMGGLDNAAPNQPAQYLNNYVFLRGMVTHNQNIFNKMDGFSSHSYPNPNFAQPPSDGAMGISTYIHEYDFINQYTASKKPAFITETGWNGDELSEDTIGKYYDTAFKDYWIKNSDKIVAVTPFLLESHGGFDKFSFIKDGKPTKFHNSIVSLPKVKGQPTITQPRQATATEISQVQTLEYVVNGHVVQDIEINPLLKFYFKSILGL